MASTKKDDSTKKTATDKFKRLTVNLPPDVHQAFKIRCIEQGLDMSEVIVGFIGEYLKLPKA